jgi:hypothetical protein
MEVSWAERERFIISMTITDRHFEQPPLTLAVSCDQALLISTHAVGNLKDDSACGVSTMTLGAVVELIRTKEMRRDILVMIANQLAAQLADRLEDAEGWHDASRIDPARKSLGWRDRIPRM